MDEIGKGALEDAVHLAKSVLAWGTPDGRKEPWYGYAKQLASALLAMSHWLGQADEYLAADDAEGRDDPGNVRRHLRAGICALLSSQPGREPDESLPSAEEVRGILKGYSAGAGAPPFDPWQPISTAPKDHHLVLAWSVETGRVVAFRDVTWTWWPNPASYPLRDRPTHWMPLPARPGEAAAGEKAGLTQAQAEGRSEHP